jgi:DNA-binding Xre family transcriptional regulator
LSRALFIDSIRDVLECAIGTVVSEKMTIRLRVKEIATARGENAATLARQTGLGITTIRRYWHGTALGTTGGRLLENVNLAALEAIADVLNVEPGELIERVK